MVLAYKSPSVSVASDTKLFNGFGVVGDTAVEDVVAVKCFSSFSMVSLWEFAITLVLLVVCMITHLQLNVGMYLVVPHFKHVKVSS